MSYKKKLIFALMSASVFAVTAQDAANTTEDAAKATEEAAKTTEEAAPEQKKEVELPKSMRFRSGTIFNAEIGFVEPEIIDRSQFDVSGIENPAYAELTVKLDPGKGISRFDYTLAAGTKSYPCIAVAKYPDVYSMAQDKWAVKKADSGKFYRMLFVIPSDGLDESKLKEMSLMFELLETRRDKVESLFFRVMPVNTNFTDPKDIRGNFQNGMYGMTYAKLNGIEEAPAANTEGNEGEAPADETNPGVNVEE